MKILLAEDDAVSMLILRRSVESLGHACVVARDGLAAYRAFQEHAPDVVISDWLMPGIEGIEFCRRIRAAETGSYTYFIFMTSLSTKQHFIEGMQAGADDYLIKPVDIDDLKARLIAASRVTSLHRKLIEQNAELERLSKQSYEAARTDPLTQLGNRLRLREDLERLRARVERYGHRYSAALCDVDFFKKFNDSHGHLAGDEVLLKIGETLAKEVRAGDAVYRYGGEEFLIIFPEQTEKSAILAMDRIRSAVERLGLPHRGKIPPGLVTMSVGISEMQPGDVPPWDGWIKRADEALYLAKDLGRNRVVGYASSKSR